MAEHPLTSAALKWFNKINAETSIVSRCNDEQLTKQQKADFDSLSEEVKKRYYGSGLIIPENVKGKRVLDIGCGSGSLVFILSKLVGPTGHVVGVDLCEGLIHTAKDQSDYHCKLWGYDEPNFEFQILNAEKLDEANFQPEEFDIIVSNGVVCIVPDKERVFRAAYTLLKPGGQFYVNDVMAEKDAPEQHKENETLWVMGTTGAMKCDALASLAVATGFTTPHLTGVAPISISEHYSSMLDNRRYACAGWRLFKLGTPARNANQGPALVTYNGGITDFHDAFPWDVDLTFKSGVGVEVDEELATLLSSIYLSDCFSFQSASEHPITRRAQNPFELMDKLEAEGRLPAPIYEIE